MKKNNITYLGIPGSYSYIAAIKFFNYKNMQGINSIKSIFENVTKGLSDFGIIPLENSTTGSIMESYDEILKYHLSIIGELFLKINHNLLTIRKNVDIKKIKFCLSHPQSFLQCQQFFTNYPWIKPVFTSDTATAAKQLQCRSKNEFCAIGSVESAKIYRLSIFQRNIEDSKANFTRFGIVAKKQNKTGNKITIIFSVKHKPASLYQALTPYAQYGLNLTKIESRPIIGKLWEYIFILDFEIKNLKILPKILKEMKKTALFLKLAGIYQQGNIYES